MTDGDMHADAVADRLAVDLHLTADCVGVDADLAEAGRCVLPFQLGELLLARGTDKTRFGPVGPVATDAVAGVGDDQPEFLQAGDVDIDIHRVTGRAGRDHPAIEQRLRIGRQGSGRSPAERQQRDDK